MGNICINACQKLIVHFRAFKAVLVNFIVKVTALNIYFDSGFSYIPSVLFQFFLNENALYMVFKFLQFIKLLKYTLGI